MSSVAGYRIRCQNPLDTPTVVKNLKPADFPRNHSKYVPPDRSEAQKLYSEGCKVLSATVKK